MTLCGYKYDVVVVGLYSVILLTLISMTSVNAWYTAVFGIDVGESKKDLVDIDPKYFVNHFGNNITKRDNKEKYICGREVEKFFWLVGTELDKKEDWVLSYHNGYQDTNCKFHGHHWHWFLRTDKHPTSDARWGRNLQEAARACQPYKVYFSAQAARAPVNLLAHIIKEPRELIAHKGEGGDMLENAKTYNTELEDPTVAPKKESVNYTRLTTMMDMMKKYHTVDENALEKQIFKTGGDEWKEWTKLQSAANFNQLIAKAVHLTKVEWANRPMNQRLEDATPKAGSLTHNLEKSLEILERWLTTQEKGNARITTLGEKNLETIPFTATTFIHKLYNVLNKQERKKNAIWLFGEPNVGKSYILRSVVALYKDYGEVRLSIKGYDFAYENALLTGVTFIDEPTISPNSFEQFKLLLEGAGTKVRRKNKTDVELESGPILLASNRLLWENLGPIEQSAILARTFWVHDMKPCPMLKKVKGDLNPQVWKVIFDKYGCKIDPTFQDSIDDVNLSDDSLDDTVLATCDETPPMETEEFKGMSALKRTLLPQTSSPVKPPKKAKLSLKQFDGAGDDSDNESEEELDDPHIVKVMPYLTDDPHGVNLDVELEKYWDEKTEEEPSNAKEIPYLNWERVRWDVDHGNYVANEVVDRWYEHVLAQNFPGVYPLDDEDEEKNTDLMITNFMNVLKSKKTHRAGDITLKKWVYKRWAPGKYKTDPKIRAAMLRSYKSIRNKLKHEFRQTYQYRFWKIMRQSFKIQQNEHWTKYMEEITKRWDDLYPETDTEDDPNPLNKILEEFEEQPQNENVGLEEKKTP